MDTDKTFELPLPGLSRVISAQAVCDANETVTYLTDPALFDATGTVVVFTERGGGISEAPYRSLDLATHVGDDPMAVAHNRLVLLEALGFSGYSAALVNPLQVHGTTVDVITEDNRNYFTVTREGSDAVACNASGIPVLLCFADCAPVVVVAPDGSFAVIHAGWRGVLSEISLIATRTLLQVLRPDDPVAQRVLAKQCNAYIGPHIGACCFETGEDVKDLFLDHFGLDVIAGGNVDLTHAITVSLTKAGLDIERVYDAHICTACHTDRFFSYRAEDATTGRFGALVCREESRKTCR